MKRKQKQKMLLIFLIAILLAINYPFLDKLTEKIFLNREKAVVKRVIDGDTIETDIGVIRLLGINAPERGELYYFEAKKFLEETILNKEVELEMWKENKDKYGRLLRYIFIGEKNVNKEILENGFANIYYPKGKDVYYKELENAWARCLDENKNLCEHSKNACSLCVELKKFEHENEVVVFYNKCSFDCNLTWWSIKDEGRKKFVFDEFVLEKNKEVKIIAGEGENNGGVLFWRGKKYVWTKTGDTLFLRDEKEKLVLWRGY